MERGCDDSGLKFGAWRKPDSYLGGAKSESCKTGSFLQPWRCCLLLLFAPFYTDLSLNFNSRSDVNPVHFSSEAEVIGEKWGFFSSPVFEAVKIIHNENEK